MVTNTVYHFADSKLGVEISSKKRDEKREQKNDAFKQRTEAPLHIRIRVSKNFHAQSVCFLLYFW